MSDKLSDAEVSILQQAGGEAQPAADKCPLVSVVIPTFNRAHMIRHAIESVVAQTYRPLELIIVDDASDDDTAEVIGKLELSIPLTFLRHEENKGGATARNTGIDAARGEYIAFLDSDDTWLPKKLEKQIFTFSSNKNHEVICYSQVLMEKNGIKIVVPSRNLKKTEHVADYLFLNMGKNYVHTSTLLVPSEIARRVKFSDGLQIHQDWDFCIRLYAENVHFLFVAEPLAIWNVDDRHDRMGIHEDRKIEQSLRWINEVRHIIPTRAYNAFNFFRAPLLVNHNRRLALRFMILGTFFSRIDLRAILGCWASILRKIY